MGRDSNVDGVGVEELGEGCPEDGGRVAAHRALKPLENVGGKSANRYV
jgi:hypothetical protein